MEGWTEGRIDGWTESLIGWLIVCLIVWLIDLIKHKEFEQISWEENSKDSVSIWAAQDDGQQKD
jgi:hypothetical protein